MRYLATFGAASLGLAATTLHAATISVGVDAAFQEEAVVSGSISSGGDFVTRIRWDIDAESRGVYEFHLPALPAGSSNAAASIAYSVMETTTNIGESSSLRFHSYAGNGRFDASDVHQTTPAGLSGPLPSTGDKATVLSAERVNTLRSGGATWLGLMAWQDSFGHLTGVGRGVAGAIVPRVTYTADVPDVGTITTRALFDTKATRDTDGYVLVDGDEEYTISAQELAPSVDRRGILEFHLGGVPDGATITSASLTFDVSSYTFSGAERPQPRIYGYVGNGTADVADATETETLLAVSSAVQDLGLHTIELDTAAIEALLAGDDDILGILVRGSENFKQFGYYTLEGAGLDLGVPVNLSISYAVPEPACLTFLGAAVVLITRKRRS